MGVFTLHVWLRFPSLVGLVLTVTTYAFDGSQIGIHRTGHIAPCAVALVMREASLVERLDGC